MAAGRDVESYHSKQLETVTQFTTLLVPYFLLLIVITSLSDIPLLLLLQSLASSLFPWNLQGFPSIQTILSCLLCYLYPFPPKDALIKKCMYMCNWLTLLYSRN